MPLLRRALFAVVVIWLAVTLAFVALRVLPGDLVAVRLLGSGATRSQIDAERARLGLDDPLWLQYVHYLVGLVRGDLGESLSSGLPVTEVIAQQLPATGALALAALSAAVVIGLMLGTLGALDREPVVSSLARFIANLSLSTPIYWSGTLAIYVFSVQLALLPSSGAGRVSQLILPSLVLGFAMAGAIARVVQANVRDVRGADFVRAARARGLPETYILLRHVLRAVLVPVVTVIALQAGFLLGGVVITETLFVRPGIGRILLDATLRQDYPVVQGIVVLAAVVYTLLNTTADALYRLLDPRVAA